LKTVSQPFSGFLKTTEKCRLFQRGRFKSFIDFYLGFASPVLLCLLSFFSYLFIFFLDQVFKIPLSEGAGSRERERERERDRETERERDLPLSVLQGRPPAPSSGGQGGGSWGLMVLPSPGPMGALGDRVLSEGRAKA
jgi:hypothetical protein